MNLKSEGKNEELLTFSFLSTGVWKIHQIFLQSGGQVHIETKRRKNEK